MAKYVCTICGFIYDEEKSIPESHIKAGTRWEQLPEDWVCPLCGAAKAVFKKQGGEESDQENAPVKKIRLSAKSEDMTPLEISALCSNLSRGSEKQYQAERSALFAEIGEYFRKAAPPAPEVSYDLLAEKVKQDLDEDFPNAHAIAQDAGDRGALRALVWSEKTSLALKSLVANYLKDGEDSVADTDVHLCTICGFIYAGEDLPEICPVCKVPNWKIEKIERKQ